MQHTVRQSQECVSVTNQTHADSRSRMRFARKLNNMPIETLWLHACLDQCAHRRTCLSGKRVCKDMNSHMNAGPRTFCVAVCTSVSSSKVLQVRRNLPHFSQIMTRTEANSCKHAYSLKLQEEKHGTNLQVECVVAYLRHVGLHDEVRWHGIWARAGHKSRVQRRHAVTRLQTAIACMYACVCVCVCACVCVACVFWIQANAHVHASMYVCTCTFMHCCAHASWCILRLFASACIFIHLSKICRSTETMYIYIYTYI